MATFIEYFDHPKPDLYIYLTEYKVEDLSSKELESSYTRFFNECLESHKSLKL